MLFAGEKKEDNFENQEKFEKISEIQENRGCQCDKMSKNAEITLNMPAVLRVQPARNHHRSPMIAR